MKKLLGVIGIITVVGIYFLLTKEKYNEIDTNAVKEKQISKEAYAQIEEIKKQIEQNYPAEAKGIIEVHNALMGIGYKWIMSDEEIEEYADTIRLIYSQELNEINPREMQIAQLKDESEQMTEDKLQLIASEIKEIYVAKDDKGHEVSAEINVFHSTTLGGVYRTYYLTKEENQWKINGWESTQEAQ